MDNVIIECRDGGFEQCDSASAEQWQYIRTSTASASAFD
jgi:hypothetical protein